MTVLLGGTGGIPPVNDGAGYLEGCHSLYEFETSKLTNSHTHPTRDAALWSYNRGNFFGLLTFDLRPADPTVTFRCVASDGQELYSLELRRSELDFKE
jgi:alkaline phosphatase D